MAAGTGFFRLPLLVLSNHQGRRADQACQKGPSMDLKTCRKDCLLGVFSALLLLTGDVIYAASTAV